jgi:hypothetical protein
VPHQQVGEDGGQLPEDVEPDQVVGGDQAHHRAGEGEEHRAGPGWRVVVAEVPAAVDQHQGPDPADHQREHPLEHTDPERDLDTECRDPCEALGQHLASQHGGALRQGPDERGQWGHGEQEEGAAAQPTEQQRSQEAHTEVHGDEEGHERLPSSDEQDE